MSDVDLYHWRTQNGTFTEMAGFLQNGADLTDTDEPARVQVAYVTSNLAHTLGIPPAIGREFVPEEEQGGGGTPFKPVSGHPKAMVSYGLWQRRFGGARDVAGKALHLDNIVYTVVGVLPPESVYPTDADVWVPLSRAFAERGYSMEVIGRLKPGVTVRQAAADLARIHDHIPEARSHKSGLTFPRVTPLRDRYLGDYRAASGMLLSAVGLVLLIGCLNVAGLMMARGTAREREVAIRIALGAGQGRLVWQFLTESALLAAGSTIGGTALGWIAVRAILSLMPDWCATSATAVSNGPFVRNSTLRTRPISGSRSRSSSAAISMPVRSRHWRGGACTKSIRRSPSSTCTRCRAAWTGRSGCAAPNRGCSARLPQSPC